MNGNCADTARIKIQAASADFWGKVQAAYVSDDKPVIKEALYIMQAKIGTKMPYAFNEIAEKYRPTVAGFWNQVTAAYAFCREDQRSIVAARITQTLNRLEVLLERINE